MAGLLDTLLGDTPDRQAQMGLLFQGLSQRNGVGGLLAANQHALQAPDRRRQAEMEAMRMQLLQAQVGETMAQGEERKANAAKQQAALEQARRLQAGIPGLFGGGMSPGAFSPSTDGMGPTMPQSSAPQAGGFDVRRALELGMDPKMIAEYAGLTNIGRQKVARTVKGMGPDNREFEYQVDEFGQRVGDGLPQYRAPISVNQGDRTTFADPYNLKPMGAFQTNQSPDSKASNAVTMRGQNMTDARARLTAEAGGVPAGYRRTLTGLEFIPGGPADPDTAKRAGLTEDQGKATGWLVQAENAWKNMRAVAFDKDGKVTSAARPGFNDALAAIPSFGATEAIANTMRGADRQKFMQASSSLSEALLRAATGAGVNRDEAIQKVRELTPVFGEDDETTKQKMASIPVYMEALKVRAGPGAVKANAITRKGGAEAGWDQNDPLGLRK